MWNFITTLISPAVSLVGSLLGYAKTKLEKHKELKLARHAFRVAREKRLADLAMQAGMNDLELSRMQMTTQMRLFKIISFISFTAPFVWGIVFPTETVYYFTEVVAHFPEWVIWTYVAIHGAIWGLGFLPMKIRNKPYPILINDPELDTKEK